MSVWGKAGWIVESVAQIDTSTLLWVKLHKALGIVKQLYSWFFGFYHRKTTYALLCFDQAYISVS